MKSAKAAGIACLAGFAAINSQPAVATDSGWYGGFDVAQSKAKIDDARFPSEPVGSGLAAASMSDDDRDIAFKVFGGLKFNRNFALEAGYFNLGAYGLTATTSPKGNFTRNISFSGIDVDALGILPFSGKFSAFGRIGVQYAQTKESYAGPAVVGVVSSNSTERDTNYKYGLGIHYDFNESLRMRAEAERYRVDDAFGSNGNVNLVSVSLVYRFGGKTPAQAPRAATHLPPQAAVAAPGVGAVPVMFIAPVQTRTQGSCSGLNIQFDSARNDSEREYQDTFDKAGIFVQKYPDATAALAGHTDEVGRRGTFWTCLSAGQKAW